MIYCTHRPLNELCISLARRITPAVVFLSGVKEPSGSAGPRLPGCRPRRSERRRTVRNSLGRARFADEGMCGRWRGDEVRLDCRQKASTSWSGDEDGALAGPGAVHHSCVYRSEAAGRHRHAFQDERRLRSAQKVVVQSTPSNGELSPGQGRAVVVPGAGEAQEKVRNGTFFPLPACQWRGGEVLDVSSTRKHALSPVNPRLL
jgi:hypothetical protein